MPKSKPLLPKNLTLVCDQKKSSTNFRTLSNDLFSNLPMTTRNSTNSNSNEIEKKEPSNIVPASISSFSSNATGNSIKILESKESSFSKDFETNKSNKRKLSNNNVSSLSVGDQESQVFETQTSTNPVTADSLDWLTSSNISLPNGTNDLNRLSTPYSINTISSASSIQSSKSLSSDFIPITSRQIVQSSPKLKEIQVLVHDSPEEIERPKKKFKSSPPEASSSHLKNNKNENTCSICLDSFHNSGPHQICCLPCGHLFGKS